MFSKIKDRIAFIKSSYKLCTWWTSLIETNAIGYNGDDRSIIPADVLMLQYTVAVTNIQLHKFWWYLFTYTFTKEFIDKHPMYRGFDVDYFVTTSLKHACKFADINSNRLPIKTTSYIDKNNECWVRRIHITDWIKL
jgi:hypothetical protein